MITLIEMLSRYAAEQPDTYLAADSLGVSLTYAEAWGKVRKVAAALNQQWNLEKKRLRHGAVQPKRRLFGVVSGLCTVRLYLCPGGQAGFHGTYQHDRRRNREQTVYCAK